MSNISVVESGTAGNLWWRIYSDGWIEQGGVASMPVREGVPYTLTFPKAFRDTTYTLTRATYSTNSRLMMDPPKFNGDEIVTVFLDSEKTSTTIKLFIFDTGKNEDENKEHHSYWAACGWGA